MAEDKMEPRQASTISSSLFLECFAPKTPLLQGWPCVVLGFRVAFGGEGDLPQKYTSQAV